MAFDRIAVVGAGAWGCALANVIARAGRPVLLATRDRAGAERIVSRRESPRLPGLKLDERIGIAPLSAAVGRYDAILLAVPSQHLRAAARRDRARARARHAGDRLRQGDRARHPPLHDRGDRGERRRRAACRSCRARASPPTWHAGCRRR